MKIVLYTLLAILLAGNIAFSQITVQLASLPDVNDQLLYQTIVVDISAPKIDNQVFQSGANQQWDFSAFEGGIETVENYQAAQAGTVADSFPDADLVIDFLGLNGYAKRNTTNISILGIAGDSVASFPIPIVGALNSPFVVRRAPFTYQDQFTTNTSFSVTLNASVLDTIQVFQDLISQLPGTTVDSLRVTLQINRTEDVDAWGTVTLPSGSVPAVKMTQSDEVLTQIEIYAVTFVGSAWIDLAPFLPENIDSLLTVNSTNHLFFSAEKKELIADLSMAPDSTLLAARYARDISSGLFEKFVNLLDIDIYPNPSSSNLFIEYPDGFTHSSGLTLQIFDITGQLMYRRIMSGNTTIDLSTWPKSQYILTIKDEQELLFRQSVLVQ